MCDPLGLGGQRGRAVPLPCRCCAWESAWGKPGFLLLSTSSQTCLLQRGGFSSLAVATVPCGLAGFLSPCLCSRSAHFNPDSGPITGCCRRESGPGKTRSPGGAMPQHPGSWRQEAKVSRGVYGLSIIARRSPGKSLHRAAPSGSWSQGRLRTMGGEQETPHGKQDLAPPPPPATAPWPLSFPCSREPFPQPSATGLRRGDGDAAARAGWGMRPSAQWVRRRVRTLPGQAGSSAWLGDPEHTVLALKVRAPAPRES